jgi:hypothetical protein
MAVMSGPIGKASAGALIAASCVAGLLAVRDGLGSRADYGSFKGEIPAQSRPHVGPFVEAVLATARTDRGRVISFRINPDDSSPNAGDEADMLGKSGLTWRVIRTGLPDARYSCHGWVFTGVPCHLTGRDVELILKENDYREVAAPAAGDVIVYRDARGAIAHSGLVRAAAPDGLVLVESKWGALGRYVHRPEDQKYGLEYRYFRSLRSGHRLAAVSSPADGAEEGEEVAALSRSLERPRKAHRRTRDHTWPEPTRPAAPPSGDTPAAGSPSRGASAAPARASRTGEPGTGRRSPHERDELATP